MGAEFIIIIWDAIVPGILISFVSHRWTPSKQGFACSVKPPPRQDFAIFIRFLVVGAKEALAEREQNRKDSVSSKPLGGTYTHQNKKSANFNSFKKLKQCLSKSMVPSNSIITGYDCVCVLELSHQGKVLSLILKPTKNQLKTVGPKVMFYHLFSPISILVAWTDACKFLCV